MRLDTDDWTTFTSDYETIVKEAFELAVMAGDDRELKKP